MHVMKHSRAGLHMHLVQQRYRITDQRCTQIMQMYVPTSDHYVIQFFLSKPPEDALHCPGQARVKEMTKTGRNSNRHHWLHLGKSENQARLLENLKI